jgi:hypothetical protein
MKFSGENWLRKNVSFYLKALSKMFSDSTLNQPKAWVHFWFKNEVMPVNGNFKVFQQCSKALLKYECCQRA